MSFLPLSPGIWLSRHQQVCSWIRASITVLVVSSGGHAALGQTSPAHGPLPKQVAGNAPAVIHSGSSGVLAGTHEDSVVDDIPLADYLALLGKIAPAAETGARSYMAAFQLRCGRALTSDELRRAISQDSGDPVLMGFIRAAQVQDITARQRLAERIRCPVGGGR